MQKFIPPKPFETAVLFLVFNRLDTAKEVFAEIKKAKPPRLYIASDGAREVKHGESDIVNAVRNYILDNIDWDCEVKTLFRDQNLGCKYAVSSAISWFFDNEEQGIILEDDCLPSQSFFWYCEELLNKYKYETKIFMISGNNFQDGLIYGDASYYFSIFPHIWGWATWSRCWKLYDVEFVKNNKITTGFYPAFINYNLKYKKFWNKIFKAMYKINTWDYQLSFSIFKNKMLCINPNVNLVTNIGFGPDATHTMSINDSNANLSKFEINHIVHPKIIEVCTEGDIYSSNKFFTYIPAPFILRLKNKIKALFK